MQAQNPFRCRIHPCGISSGWQHVVNLDWLLSVFGSLSLPSALSRPIQKPSLSGHLQPLDNSLPLLMVNGLNQYTSQCCGIIWLSFRLILPKFQPTLACERIYSQFYLFCTNLFSSLPEPIGLLEVPAHAITTTYHSETVSNDLEVTRAFRHCTQNV